jgi:hypothetical protein
MEPIKQELFKQAVSLARAGQRDEARRYFIELAKEYPTNTKVLLWLVYTGKDLSLSERLLDRVAQLEPDNRTLPAAREWLEICKVVTIETESVFGQEPLTLSPQFPRREVNTNFTLLESTVEQPYRDPPPPPPLMVYKATKASQNDIFTTLRTTLKIGGYILSGILVYFIFFNARNNVNNNSAYSNFVASYPASFAPPRTLTSTELNISRSKCLENSRYLESTDLKPDELRVLNIESYCYSINATAWQAYMSYYDKLLKRNNWDYEDEMYDSAIVVYNSSLGEVIIEYSGKNKAGGYQLKEGEGLLIVLVIKERGKEVANIQAP